MAKIFKVKYKERAVIQRAIQRQIQKYGLVDTFSMKDSVRIAAGSRVSLGRLYFTVVALYYYRFHDTFASDGYTTKNGIEPVDITIGAFKDPKVQEAIGSIFQQYTEWLASSDAGFKGLFDPNDLNFEVHVGFEFYGSPDSKWNKAIAFERLTS